MQPRLTATARTDAGTGEPAALYLPGWCGGREVFAPLLVTTAGTRRSVSADWRGHGGSPRAATDFGADDLVRDTVDLIGEVGLDPVVPVALSHAGWIALELRRALGPDRVPGVVLLDWMPLGPPPGFAHALAGLQDPKAWDAARAQLFAIWTAGVEDETVLEYVDSMGTYGFDMWARAGREILRAFTETPVPLAAFGALDCPVLHLYAQPRDEGFLAAQQAYADGHPWFRVRRLGATSHFPCLEVPDEIAGHIDEFVAALP